VSSFASSLKDLRDSRLGQAVTRLRTEDDLPISLTVGGSIALAIVLTLLPQVGVNLLGAILIVIFGFFFATVSSRVTGQIGSSANPISGMTIAALLGTCLIFVAIGWTGVDHRVQAISIAAVVAVATANAGNTSQDLKTGFLVGSTPRRQQIAILVGALGSALVVGWTLTLLNRSFTYPIPESHPAFSAGALAPTAGGRAPVEIEVVVRSGADRIEAEYIGEPRPPGVAGRMLAPGGGVVQHWDRFILPSITQVEYRLEDNHLLVTSALTPVTPTETRLHSAVTFSLRVPHALIKALLPPLAGLIFAQDARILRRQAETIDRFGGEQFASTEIDVLGQGILRLLRRAERGEPGPDPSEDLPPERHLRMRV